MNLLGHEQTAAVLLRGGDADQGMVRFAMYFEEQYRALEKAGVFEESDIVELTDYLDALAVQGEFEHSMDKPMLEFLNGMLDMLILPPLIEAMTGEELLTGEDLSGGQRIMKAVGATMDMASIGQASLANGILKTGGRQALGILGKAATVEIESNLAAYSTVSLGEALGLPVAVTIALGIGVGGGTHVKLSKVMFSDMDSAAVRAVSMTDADEEVPVLRYQDEAAEAGRGVSRVSGSEGDSGVLNEDVFTRYMPDGSTVTDFAHLPGNIGIEVPRRLSVEEMAYLTQEYGVEFAQVYQRGGGVNGGGGKYYIYSGDVSSVKVPINKDIILINHTHPGGTAYPSQADKKLLSLLGQVGSPQKTSEIIPIGNLEIIKFGVDGIK